MLNMWHKFRQRTRFVNSDRFWQIVAIFFFVILFAEAISWALFTGMYAFWATLISGVLLFVAWLSQVLKRDRDQLADEAGRFALLILLLNFKRARLCATVCLIPMCVMGYFVYKSSFITITGGIRVEQQGTQVGEVPAQGRFTITIQPSGVLRSFETSESQFDIVLPWTTTVREIRVSAESRDHRTKEPEPVDVQRGATFSLLVIAKQKKYHGRIICDAEVVEESFNVTVEYPDCDRLTTAAEKGEMSFVLPNTGKKAMIFVENSKYVSTNRLQVPSSDAGGFDVLVRLKTEKEQEELDAANEAALEQLRSVGLEWKWGWRLDQKGDGDDRAYVIEGKQLEVADFRQAEVFLSQLTRPYRLSLDQCNNLVRLDGLRGATELELLRVKNCNELINVDDIGQLEKLKQLIIENCMNVLSLSALGRSASLESIHANACESLSTLWSPDTGGSGRPDTGGLGRLETLNLADCDNLKDLSGCQGLDSLKVIDLSGCGTLQTLQGLQNLSNLKVLDVSHCIELLSLGSLEGLPELCTVNLYGCAKLTSLSGVSKCPEIGHLDLRSCVALKSLTPLADRKNRFKLLLGGNVGLEDLGSLGDAIDFASIYVDEDSHRTISQLFDRLPESTRDRFQSRRTKSDENECGRSSSDAPG